MEIQQKAEMLNRKRERLSHPYLLHPSLYLSVSLPPSEHCPVRRLHHVQGLWPPPAERLEEDRGRPTEDERGAERREAQGEFALLIATAAETDAALQTAQWVLFNRKDAPFKRRKKKITRVNMLQRFR